MEAIRKAGLKTELLTTAITNVEDPHTEAIQSSESTGYQNISHGLVAIYSRHIYPGPIG